MKVFETTEGVEVFANESGGITIRQESAVGDEPAIIAVPVSQVSALCKALRVVMREIVESDQQ